MTEKSRQSFVFYESFQEAIDCLPDHEQLLVYRAISYYALQQQEPQLEGMAKLAWVLIKPQLDANWRKYIKGCRGAEAGKKGGRPRKNPLGVISETANVNVNVNDNVNVNVNDSTTTTPSIDTIRDFIESNQLSVDAYQFYNYYSANGWMMGKNPMADWQAALRSWGHTPEPSFDPQNTPFKVTHYDDL